MCAHVRVYTHKDRPKMLPWVRAGFGRWSCKPLSCHLNSTPTSHEYSRIGRGNGEPREVPINSFMHKTSQMAVSLQQLPLFCRW